MSLLPSLGIFPSLSTQMTVCAKYLQEGTHTPPWGPLTPYLVPQRFSRWRKPAEADFPGAESVGIGIQRCAQAALGRLGDLAHASH